MQTKTWMAKQGEVSRKWHLLNAEGQVLGRLAAQAAHLLRGKHKAIFTPHVDCGDGVIVVNAEKVRVTGTKLRTKVYKRFRGYPGGLKQETLEHLLQRRPTEAVRRAVTGMLPSNPLGREVSRRLRVYAGPAHPHTAQIQQETVKE